MDLWLACRAGGAERCFTPRGVMDSVIKPDLWLDRLRGAIVAVENSGDQEAVHTLRVATRRIDAWLQLAGIRVLRHDLRRLRHAAGSVRDIDVIRVREGLPPQVETWLDDEYPAARDELFLAVQDESTGALLEALRLLPPLLESDARLKLERIVRRVFRAGEQLDKGGGDTGAFHRLRRRVKLLRYAREWLGERPQSLVRLQTALGEMNDTAVLLRLLEEHPRPDAATHEFEARCQDTLAAQSFDAIRIWSECERDLREESERWIST